MALDFVSHSAIDQYLKCSWQYRLQRVDKVAVAPAWFFMGGTAVHAATALMDQRDEYPYSDDQLEYIWSESFNAEIAKAYEEWPNDRDWRTVGRPSKLWPEGQRYRYWNDRGLAAIKAWQKWRLEHKDRLSVIGIEVSVEYTLPSGIQVKGFIDRVMWDKETNNLFVLDIKTGTKRPQSPVQLAIYRQGLMQISQDLPGVNVSPEAAWWMAKDGEMFPVPVAHLGPDQLDIYAKNYMTGVENEVFIPNISDACFFCPFTKQCFARN